MTRGWGEVGRQDASGDRLNTRCNKAQTRKVLTAEVSGNTASLYNETL